MNTQPELKVLFQGDSITDAGREYENDAVLGHGYAAMVAAFYSAAHPERHIRFINKGISGNRTRDLCVRWENDCISLQPDVLSVLIGINDVWRRYDKDDPTTCDEFKDNYRRILTDAVDAGVAHIILLEPFLLHVNDERKSWREDLDPKINAVRELARDFSAALIPLDGLFAAASAHRNPAFWAADGVHPTQAGHALIAQNWLDKVDV